MDRRTFLMASSVFGLSGCLWNKQTTRSQRPDEESGELRTVGDVSMFDTLTGVPVGGVGLVVGLDGSGGGTPPGEDRKQLEEYLKKKGFDNPKQIVDSPNHALVIVSGIVPPGTRRNDTIDLTVRLPQGSRAKSLRGGYLAVCDLFTYTDRETIRQFVGENSQSGANRMVRSHTVVIGEGIVHGSINPDSKARTDSKESSDLVPMEVKNGHVWGGGRLLENRPYYIILKPEHQRLMMGKLVADRINETFFGGGIPTDQKVAVPGKNHYVSLNVPPQYRLNLPHYLRVVRAIPLERPTDMTAYRNRLEEMLLDTSTTLSAAIRMEAMGKSFVPSLKFGLESPYPLVRFACSEALAYLGETSSVKELAHLAGEHPSLQAYCLTALGSMDAEAFSIDKLLELTSSPQAEVRYGAFRALRECDPTTRLALGETLHFISSKTDEDEESRAREKSYHRFYLHQVPSKGPGLVHALSGKRAEIVLFGEHSTLIPNCSLTVGEFAVTARKGDESCSISRFSTKKGHQLEQCSLEIVEVIRTLSRLGATYQEVIEILRQADDIKSLSCAFALDALPKAVTIKQLAEQGRTDPKMQSEADLLRSGGDDLGTTPTLYDRGNPPEVNDVARQ